MTTSDRADPIDFPSDHIFKAVGDNREGFVDSVRRAVSSVVPVSLDAVKTRESAGGKYVSVSVVARLDNRLQLEDVYRELKKVEGVRYLL